MTDALFVGGTFCSNQQWYGVGGCGRVARDRDATETSPGPGSSASAGAGMDAAGLNRLPREQFVEILGDVFEHCRWIAERVYDARPFRSVEELHAAMVHVVNTATRAEQLALLRGHPELAGREAQEGVMTPASTSEQGRLGFDAVPRDELERMTRLNRAYREKFGFPCIIALRGHRSRDTVVAEHERRLGNDPETEMGAALAQVFLITRGRLDTLWAAPQVGRG